MSSWTGPTLEVHADHVRTLDQTRLPFETEWLSLRSLDDCARAIREMQIRGAPLIGVVAAFGLAFALREDASEHGLESALQRLRATRPTAVNLQWALDRVRDAVRLPDPQPGAATTAITAMTATMKRTDITAMRAMMGEGPAERAWAQAVTLAHHDVRVNEAIGLHGLALVRDRMAWRQQQGRPVQAQAPLQLLTHCNAGRLATVDHGTALAPIYRAAAEGIPLHVWVDETRPRNQGASLTAWELTQAGVACTVVADNAGAWLMQQGRVDAVIVGCDRVAANADVANKIGTLLKALAADHAGVPFWVACPASTIDAAMPDGRGIPIEMRDPRELTHIRGRTLAGELADVALMHDGVHALNPAFDVTPARLVRALISEWGVVDASAAGVRAILDRARPGATP